MRSSTTIQFHTNEEIDKPKWDECIEASPNGLIYARTFFLDNIAQHWNALTGENYEWVLPLTHRTKYGITYLYQPPFCQQLGVFAKPDVIVPYKEIIQSLQQHYKFCEVNWNYHTQHEFNAENFEVNEAVNLVLNLNSDYENIAANYHNDLIKNLKRASKFQLAYQQTEDYTQCIELYRQFYGDRTPHVKERDYVNFSTICGIAKNHNMLVCREVINTNEVMATALLLKDGKRLYNLMNTTTEAGRKKEANHFLLDAVIKEFAAQKMLLDFEGSDLPGVKAFYENFGAVNQPYRMVKYNGLAWPFKLLKK